MLERILSGGVGLAFALVQLTSANAAFIGTFSGNDSETDVRNNLIANGVGVECDLLTLLVKWEVEKNEAGHTVIKTEGVNDGAFASLFNVTGLTYDNKAGGQWSLVEDANLNGYEIVAYAAKGGGDYNLFTPDGDGPYEWSTTGIPHPNTAGISHLSIYACKSVPEPASLLAGLLALGLGFAGRRYLA